MARSTVLSSEPRTFSSRRSSSNTRAARYRPPRGCSAAANASPTSTRAAFSSARHRRFIMLAHSEEESFEQGAADTNITISSRRHVQWTRLSRMRQRPTCQCSDLQGQTYRPLCLHVLLATTVMPLHSYNVVVLARTTAVLHARSTLSVRSIFSDLKVAPSLLPSLLLCLPSYLTLLLWPWLAPSLSLSFYLLRAPLDVTSLSRALSLSPSLACLSRCHLSLSLSPPSSPTPCPLSLHLRFPPSAPAPPLPLVLVPLPAAPSSSSFVKMRCSALFP